MIKNITSLRLVTYQCGKDAVVARSKGNSLDSASHYPKNDCDCGKHEEDDGHGDGRLLRLVDNGKRHVCGVRVCDEQ